MNKQAPDPLLSAFFSAYFHEDWPCDGDTPEGIIAKYAHRARPADVRSLSEAIRNYTREFAGDRESEENLFTELGCYYRPSADGVLAKAWLEDVARLLLSEARAC